MRKIYAFVLALLLTAAIANLIQISKPSYSPTRQQAIISRVIDGDTLELEDARIVRLLNTNAPEKDSPLSNNSKLFLLSYIGKNIEIEVLGTDKYQRTLARLYAPEYLNLQMVRQGLASKFLVEQNELKEFASAEGSAISSQKGIWRTSQYANCIKTKVNAKEETATIENRCSPINISGWLLKDESRKQYKFDSILKNEIVLHSGAGKDSENELYWKQKNIWNNDRDTLYLFDEKNNIVSHYSYGY